MSIFGRIGIVFAKKWIGGITIHDAISASKSLNGAKENVMINYLGEDIRSTSRINDAVSTYTELLNAMHRANIKGDIAVKPTQLGLKVHYAQFTSNYEQIVKQADKLGVFVWLDMEDYQTVDQTIKAYLEALRKHRNIGICLQAKLKRTMADVKQVVKNKGVVRLVKGAYPLTDGFTYARKSDVNGNYTECMAYLFQEADRFMIATHDKALIETARALEARYRKKPMFGMLKGIRPALARSLAQSHERVYIYVPFGEEWFKYSMRRLSELEHTIMVARSIAER